MDRCALFVDAGYLLADGARAVHGTRQREAVSWDLPGLVRFLGKLSRDRTGLPLLRCYWYEATVEGRRTPEHDVLADIPGIKLRLSRIRPGRREGMDAQVHRDLMTLARNNAICDAVVVSGDEDLVQVICDAQDLGIRVTVVQIAGESGWSSARALRQECDDLIEVGGGQLRPYVTLVTATGSPPSPAQGNGRAPGPAGNGQAYDSGPGQYQPKHGAPNGRSPGLPSGPQPTPPPPAGAHARQPDQPTLPAPLDGPSSPRYSPEPTSAPQLAQQQPAAQPQAGQGQPPQGQQNRPAAQPQPQARPPQPAPGPASPLNAPIPPQAPPSAQPASAPAAPSTPPPVPAPVSARQPAPQTGYDPGNGYVPTPLGPYTGPQPAPVQTQSATGTMTLAEAVKSAHKEGHEFGQSVARDAPPLWLEAVLARKPRMPSDLEARLLQGSSLPIDFLLHEEVRQALRRGFWDALERARG